MEQIGSWSFCCRPYVYEAKSWLLPEHDFAQQIKSVSDLHFSVSAKMVGENRPEKRLKLDDLKNQQDEIKRLKEVVKKQEKMLASENKTLSEMRKMLASKNKKLLEMEESKNKVEREKIKVEDEKIRFEAKLQKLVECPVCLTLPRNGPVPCCANGHLVCSPCLGKLRGEDRMEQE